MAENNHPQERRLFANLKLKLCVLLSSFSLKDLFHPETMDPSVLVRTSLPLMASLAAAAIDLLLWLRSRGSLDAADPSVDDASSLATMPTSGVENFLTRMLCLVEE